MTPYGIMDVCIYSLILLPLAQGKGLTPHNNYIPYTHKKPCMHKSIIIAIQKFALKCIYKSAV